MRRPLHTWLIFAGCLALLFAVLGWFTSHTVQAERKRFWADSQAQWHEKVRVAMSRLDFAASALVVRENARPPEHFMPFHAADESFNRAYVPLGKGEVLIPSPLLSNTPSDVLLHFQINPDGTVVSAQVPQGNERDWVEANYGNTAENIASRHRYDRLLEILKAPATLDTLRASGMSPEMWEAVRKDPSISAWGSSGEPAAANLMDMSNGGLLRIWNWENPGDPYSGQSVTQNSAWQAANATDSPEQIYALANSATQLEAQIRNDNLIQQKIATVPRAKRNQLDYANTLPQSGNLSLNPSQRLTQNTVAATQSPQPTSAEAASPASQKSQEILPSKPASEIPEAQGVPANQSALDNRTVAQAPAGNLAATASAELPAVARPLQGFWIGNEIFLTREAVVDAVRRTQGVWLDWEKLRSDWLGLIADIFPRATLKPTETYLISGPGSGETFRLASLPVQLLPQDTGVAEVPLPTALKNSLVLAWIGILLAALAVGWVLHRTMVLSERRAAFVSAVTHEMRTPLTTFRMYSEMLADDVVPSEETRKAYLGTLCSEATRLNHLVENVLSYARLERGSARKQLRTEPLRPMLETILPRLEQRAAGCLELILEIDPASANTSFTTDVAALEQILFNLVDNACKYAAPAATDRRLLLTARADGEKVRLTLRDHGPGIPKAELKRIFLPFHKSASQAAQSAPGVGLGLALCQRLCQQLGGSLHCESPPDEGAAFIVELPRGG